MQYYVAFQGEIKKAILFTDFEDYKKFESSFNDIEYEIFDNLDLALKFMNIDHDDNITPKIQDIKSGYDINQVTYQMGTVDFNKVINDLDHDINVFVLGGYDYKHNNGYYNVLIKKEARTKHILKQAINETSTNRALITGIYDSLDSIDNNVSINVITPTSLGFKKAIKSNGGINADKISELLEKAKSKCIKINVIELLGKSQEIKKYISDNTNKQ